jgi:hypothetical protein
LPSVCATASKRAQFYKVQFGDAPLVILFALFSCAMEAVDASKVVKVHVQSPLEDAGILKQVLSYAGAGEWIFYAPISKLWLECYRAVPVRQVKKKLISGDEQIVTALPYMTLRRVVYASAARVRLAYELGLRFDTDNADMLFYVGTLACRAVLAEAHRLGMPISTDLLNGAASSGELSTVIWLYTEHDCGFDDNASLCCAGNGAIEVLQWLKQQGAVFDMTTMLAAAASGQQATCAYLYSVDCPLDELASLLAAHNEHWHIVRWLHEHGCQWNLNSLRRIAAAAGDIAAMSYLLQQEPVPAIELSMMLNRAGAHDQLAVAQWLRQRGAQWPPALCSCDQSWSDDMIEWARAEGCDSPLHF